MEDNVCGPTVISSTVTSPTFNGSTDTSQIVISSTVTSPTFNGSTDTSQLVISPTGTSPTFNGSIDTSYIVISPTFNGSTDTSQTVISSTVISSTVTSLTFNGSTDTSQIVISPTNKNVYIKLSAHNAFLERPSSVTFKVKIFKCLTVCYIYFWKCRRKYLLTESNKPQQSILQTKPQKKQTKKTAPRRIQTIREKRHLHSLGVTSISIYIVQEWHQYPSTQFRSDINIHLHSLGVTSISIYIVQE